MSEANAPGQLTGTIQPQSVIDWPALQAWLVRVITELDDQEGIGLRDLDTGDWVWAQAHPGGFELEAVAGVEAAAPDPVLAAKVDALASLRWVGTARSCPQGRIHGTEAAISDPAAVADLLVTTLREAFGATDPLRVHRTGANRYGEPKVLPPLREPTPAELAVSRTVMRDGVQFQFWDGETRGLIRRRDGWRHPEIWQGGRWVFGSPRVMDAITGMSDDPYSCGEWAGDLTILEAEAMAAKERIDLYAPNPADPPRR